MKAQLAVLNQVHSQSKIDIAKPNAHGSASSNYEAVREQHLKLISSIDHFNQNMEELGMKATIKSEIQMGEIILKLGNSVNHARGKCEGIEKMVKALYTLVNKNSMDKPIINDEGTH